MSRTKTLPPQLNPSEAFAAFRGEAGGRRTSSKRQWSLARSRVASSLLLRNFASSNSANRRASVLDFHLQMENCERQMNAQLGDGANSDSESDTSSVVERGCNISWLETRFFLVGNLIRLVSSPQ